MRAGGIRTRGRAWLAGPRRLALLLAALILGAAADGQAGWVPPVVTGKIIYELRCEQCHGISGRGDGPAAAQLNPRPRDFTSGKFKFRTTESGVLPTDEDLARTVRLGLPGTSMPAWEPFLSATDITAVVAYVKTLSSRFSTEPPASVRMPPTTPSTPASIAAGRAVFETLKCAACHGTDGVGTGAIALDLKDDWGRPIAATRLNEPWTFRGGAAVSDVFLRLRTGLNGTPMRSFHEAAGDKDLWNLATYVVSLRRKPVWEMNAGEIAELDRSRDDEAARSPVGRGAYLVSTLGCAYCHTPITEDGAPIEAFTLAGGQRWNVGPWGDTVSDNLTSDKQTGLGAWTDDEIKTAVARGVRRDGSRMLPFPMPWTSYSTLKPADLSAVVAYLRTVQAISNRIPAPHQPNIVSYLWGKFRLLVLKTDLPLLTYPGNAGTPGPGAPAASVYDNGGAARATSAEGSR
jgi:mono/diheme cytochrome c family protein